VFFKVLSANLNLLLTGSLQGFTELCRQFYLAGGTALALQLGHRQSDDLDFFSEHEFDNELIIQAIMKLGARIDSESKGTMHASLSGSKVSFFHYPYPLIRNTTAIGNIRTASVEDIACMKVIAIAQRAEKKDFFDMYEILRMYSPSLVREMVIQKYGEQRINCYHIVKSFFYFEEADRSLDPVSLNSTSWQQVKDYFITNEKQLTSGLCREL
jgi:hypothetical protein